MKNFWQFIFLLGSISLSAQSYSDEALLFSRSGISGTARSVGSASAFGSVGADLGSVNINPAGLGLYRSTDICVTPGLYINRNNADFNSSSTVVNNSKVFFNQAGVAFTKLFNREKKANDFTFTAVKLNAITFAVNYQRESMLSRTQNFGATNEQSSAIGQFAAYANRTNLPYNTDNYPVEMILAKQTGLIGYDSATNSHFSNVLAPVYQSGEIITKGGIDHIDIALGGNLNDKFYFGAGIGFSILTYMQDASFTETKANDTANHFMDYTFTSNLRETGLGINAKFGIIYRPTSWMRLGLSYHIPTFYSITETYLATTVANFDTAAYGNQLEAYPLKYSLRTPMKGIFSSSFYFKQYGFLSIDYEFQNYGSTRFKFASDLQNATNQLNDIEKKQYTFGHVLRVGVEGSYKVLRVRAGYAFSSTPYKKDYITKGFTEEKHNFSVGLGYRGKHFYVDFAYLFGITKEATNPYADWEVNHTLVSHAALLTLGFRIFKNTEEQQTIKTETSKPRMKF